MDIPTITKQLSRENMKTNSKRINTERGKINSRIHSKTKTKLIEMTVEIQHTKKSLQ